MAATTINPKTGQSLKDAIVDLYLNIKIRTNDEIENFTPEKFSEEKHRLNHLDPFAVLEYIRATVEILMNLNSEENGREKTPKSEYEDPAKEYEQMIQKLEEEARNHIRVEQQLKLHIEALQLKMDELEKANQEAKTKLRKVLDESNRGGKELTKIGKELSLEQVIRKQLEEKYEKLKEKYNQLLEQNEASTQKTIEPLDKKGQAEAKRKRPEAELNNLIRSIHAPKGVGIKEQNIYQIICNSKTPEVDRAKSPYIMEFVNQKLEGKNQEISRLKQKLSKLQTEIKIRRSASRENSTRARKKSLESPKDGLTGHIRSKSQMKEEVKPVKDAYSNVYEKDLKRRKSASIKRKVNSTNVSINYGASSIENSHISSAYQNTRPDTGTKNSADRRKLCNVTCVKRDNKEDADDLKSSIRLAKYVAAKLDSVLVKYPGKKR